MKSLTISYVDPAAVLPLFDMYSAEHVTHLHLIRLRTGTGDESDEALFSEFRHLQRAAIDLPLKVTIELWHNKPRHKTLRA